MRRIFSKVTLTIAHDRVVQVLREDLEELHAYACAVAAADAEVVREAWDAMSDTT